MLLAIAIPIGLTLGAATWALVRGPGGGSGLFLCMLFAIIGSFIGGLAAQALIDSSDQHRHRRRGGCRRPSGGSGGSAGIRTAAEERGLCRSDRCRRQSAATLAQPAKTSVAISMEQRNKTRREEICR